ncbi:uncharacterized protein LOC141643141 isoform X2 [Silene latifolia]|uniref:uncharacterized protein LOC141643141 isoform X2 n=1 Tax=Silene latifolia TaxID=37657 RepID=UPI003D78635E
MESNLLSSQRSKDQEFNLNEWHLRARISKENISNSRRYSSSYIRSFREDSSRSFRSNFTISSTASSPGYHNKDEIDPSTYSFTTALKALQARSGYVWECLSPEGFALNSKWNEAERYICNPLSGEVPMECLSAKTLSGRSFRSYMASRVTMSAPLVYSLQHRRSSNFSNPVSSALNKEQLVKPPLVIPEKQNGCRTRDVGIQSNPSPHEGSSSSLSDISTPSIRERPITRCEGIEDQDDDAQNSSSTIKSTDIEEVEVKVTREGEETKRGRGGSQKKKKMHKTGQLCVCRHFSGCSLVFSLKTLFIKRWQKEKIKTPPK